MSPTTAAGWRKQLHQFGALPAHETRNWRLSKTGFLSFDIITDQPIRLSELNKLLGGLGTQEASISGKNLKVVRIGIKISGLVREGIR